jgi:CheY-like chemotaxis protein
MNQQLVRRLLEPRGHEVVVVENGAEAVAAVQKEPFDLILMDLQMPVMDGIAAAQTIRNLESSRTARTPILALTAHALPEDQERCLAAGMDGYISKPIQARQLIDTVEAFLASSSSEPPPSGSPPEGPGPGGLAGSGPSLGSTPAFGSRHFAPLPN